MCAALEHRGPDARGVFQRGNVALGIQRLRVIDLATGDRDAPALVYHRGHYGHLP